MVEFLLSQSDWVGSITAMVFTTIVGLGVYVVSAILIAKYQTGELAEAIGSLFKVVGILVGLMLSLAFGEIIIEWRNIENAMKGEAVAISDIFVDLQHFDLEGTEPIRSVLISYTQAVIDEDWPALADDELSEHARALRLQVFHGVLSLEPENPTQEELKSRILHDLDSISDFRLNRLNAALAQPPVYLYVIFFGYLVTMALFGGYPPQPPLIALVALYTSFVGLVLYLILALSDPFRGGIGLDPTQFENLVETLRTLN